MKLTDHFSVEEFTASDTAARLGIDNSLPADLTAIAIETAQMMERIRSFLGVPILVTSGYRCPELNAAIGSTSTSDHIKAMACDFKVPNYGTPIDVCRALLPELDNFGVGQIIYENTWIHVSTRKQDKPINRVLSMQGGKYSPGIHA